MALTSGPAASRATSTRSQPQAGFTWLNVYFEPLVNLQRRSDSDRRRSRQRVRRQRRQDSTYTFKLANETWHDGKPFTSKDVKFTVDLAKNGETGTVFAARLNAVVIGRDA